MKFRRRAPRWSVFACGLLLVAEAGASGHFDVDDAGTLDPGQCLVEVWAGRLRSPADLNFQHLGGACGAGPVELGFNVDRASAPGAAAAVLVGPQIKWNFWGRAPDATWSAAAALATSIDVRHGGRAGGQFLLPLSWRASDRVNVLVNAGADWATGSGAATARGGAALEWAFNEQLTLIAERNRAFDLWTSRLGARITVAPLTTIELSASRSGRAGDGRLRGVVIGLNREFSRH
jgi:hypothetical protein